MNEKKHPPSMRPEVIIEELRKRGLNQAAVARAIGCRPSSVWRAIHDTDCQSRVMSIIAEAIEKDPAEVWPRHFIDGGPKVGRKKIIWTRKAA